MKIRFIDLNEALPAINSLANTKLPAKTAYRIGKTLNKISSAIKSVEDYRINTLKRLGTLSEDKSKYIFEPPENEDEFNRLFSERKEQEVEVQFPLLTLDEIAGLNIEPAVMGGLEKIGAISELEVVDDKKEA